MAKFDKAIGNKMIKKAATVNRTEANVPKIENIDISLLDENPDNEKVFNMNGEDRLIRSIEENGFTGVVEVFKKPDGRYEISSGHRRVRAAKEAGKTSVPCIVNAMPDDVARAKKLLDSNITNRTLEPLDYARMIEYYIECVLIPSGQKGQMDAQCAEYFGISKSAVYKYRALLKMIPELQELADREEFPYTAFVSAHRLSEDKQKELYDILTREAGKHTDDNGDPVPLTRSFIMNEITRLLKDEGRYMKDGNRKPENIPDNNTETRAVEESSSDMSDDTENDTAAGSGRYDIVDISGSEPPSDYNESDKDSTPDIIPGYPYDRLDGSTAGTRKPVLPEDTAIMNELSSIKSRIHDIAGQIARSHDNDLLIQALSSVRDTIDSALDSLKDS